MPKETNKEYAYCLISKSKFIIMKRRIAPPDGWYKVAEAITEYAAQAIVDALNKSKIKL